MRIINGAQPQIGGKRTNQNARMGWHARMNLLALALAMEWMRAKGLSSVVEMTTRPGES